MQTMFPAQAVVLVGPDSNPGTGEIGKVNWRHFNVAGATLTRPAAATVYGVDHSISDNATAGSVTALTSNDLSDVNDNPIHLTEVLLDFNDPAWGIAGAVIRLHGFNSNPTSSSGVVNGNGAAYSNKRAGWFGSYSGIMRPFSDGSKGVLTPDEWTPRLVFPVSGAKGIFWQLQTLTGVTASDTLRAVIPRFKGLQGRL